jgi:hypothetical protein
MIPEAVSMEMDAVEAKHYVPATEVTEGTTFEPGAVVGPEVVVEAHVEVHLTMSTEVIIHEPVLQEAAPIRSAPMSEGMSTSRGGLELLDDNLVNPTAVARNMELMGRAK